jgi:predicted AAA+ superfamily ATPase
MFERPVLKQIVRRWSEPRLFVHVLAGPRQVGKTTLATQALERIELPSRYASADDVAGRDRDWIVEQWELGRVLAAESRRGALLVVDEIQKVPRWSETVKRLWDEDTRFGTKLRVSILGSSPLLVGRGLTESLAGRFEIIPVAQWDFVEMRDAFGWDLDRYVFFGGYPGAATLIADEDRWRRYVLDSLIETSVSRDILLLTRVDKPALLRQLFGLACELSGQVVSYTKMLGQLQDAGNTTTLAHYLDLLRGAGLVAGLPKYSGSVVRARGSSPKLVAMDTGLMSAVAGRSFADVRADGGAWGRLVETAVGAHLVRAGLEVCWWRDGNREVDYIVRHNRRVAAIEVKSGARRASLPGMAAFADHYDTHRRLLVGADGVGLDGFLTSPATRFLAR